MGYKTDKEVKNEFIKKFIGNEDPADFGVIYFILYQRQQDREAIIELVNNQKKEEFIRDENGNLLNISYEEYNQALTDLLSFLDGLEGGENYVFKKKNKPRTTKH